MRTPHVQIVLYLNSLAEGWSFEVLRLGIPLAHGEGFRQASEAFTSAIEALRGELRQALGKKEAGHDAE